MIRVDLHKRLVGAGGKFRRVADALAIDSAWSKYARASATRRDPVLLDFSELDYLDHDCLLHVGALVAFRKDLGCETLFQLPTADHVWEYMRAWNFPEFISSVADRPFVEMLGSESHEQYIDTSSRPPKYVRAIELPGGGSSELLPVTHFQLTPIGLDENPMRAATVAKDKWLETHMLSVLDAYLGEDQGQRVGSLVVLEAVLNAAMHPKAKMAFTSSQIVFSPFDQPMAEDMTAGRPTYLEIGIWDNGTPMGLTLKSRLDQGLAITSRAFGEFDESFDVRLVHANGRETFRLIRPDLTHLPAQFPWLTVAAFLAGVSSTPERVTSHHSAGGVARGPQPAGMGLRYVRRNVLNQWGGAIRYSTGSYRLSMELGAEHDIYSVTIQYRPKRSWPLQGNTLLLRIPLDHDRAARGS